MSPFKTTCLGLILLLLGCSTGGSQPSVQGVAVLGPETVPATAEPPSTTASPPPTPEPTPPLPRLTPTTPAPQPTFSPLLRAPVPCGVLLPLAPAAGSQASAVDALSPRPFDLAQVEERLPDTARPAFEHILARPGDVALVAFQAGREAEGIFLNADSLFPLASVVKWLHLVTYVEAVVDGRVDPQARISLAELDRYYLPGSDMRSHQQAVADLRSAGRVAADETIALEDVAAIMMQASSNAATDYLQALLGQQAIEETARALGLADQTAPCPFLGQFLAMSQPTGDPDPLAAYLDDPTGYGQVVMDLALTFHESADFRTAVGRWRVPLSRQRAFVATLSPHGSAADYARLMVRLAQNGLFSADSSFFARRLAEWPMRFPTNQSLFDNLAFKDGNLPGVLTLTYYAYRPGDPAPIVVVLLLRNLSQPIYNRLRRSLAHDELARWLLIDPQAIPLLVRLTR